MQISRTFEVEAPLPALRDYLADFSNAEAWDPGTQKSVRRGVGPVEVGAQWDNTSKLFGITTELVYELVQLEDDLVVLRGKNDTAVAEDRIELVPIGADRTEVTYQSTITFSGAAKLVDPVAKLGFQKVADEVEELLQREGAKLS